MSSADEKYQHMTCTDELNNMHITGTDEVDRCANCGKEGNDLNICNKCKTVKYCNVTCKKKHKSKHKKKCDRRVAELHDEALFNESPPPEECPICMLPLPIDAGQTEFKSCCGKTICNGCIHAILIEEMLRGKKKEEEVGMCAFCRTLRPNSNEEEVRRVKKLMKKGNAEAYCQLAGEYAHGTGGIQQDLAKANELLLKACELGCANAYYNLGYSYDSGSGVERNEKKAKHYYEIAAMKGEVKARCNLGVLEAKAGNHERAYKHIIIVARAGHTKSLEYVKKGFMGGVITKEEYESTLRAYHERQTETKSEARDIAAAIHST